MSSFFRRIATSFTRKAFVGALAIALGAGAWYSFGVLAAPPKADLDQARNGSAASPTSPVFFQNGNAGASNSHYTEGYSIPYRIVLTNLALGEHVLDIEWDIKHSSRNAIDFITSYDRLEPHQSQYGHVAEVVDPTQGLSGMGTEDNSFSIPDPGTAASPYFLAVPETERRISIWNGSIDDFDYLAHGNLAASQSATSARISFTATSTTVVVAWGGHIATSLDWGEGNSAGGISGAPYHTRLLALDGAGGNQDRSLSADAVMPAPQTGTIIITKDAVPNDPQNFTFTNNFGGENPATFDLDDDSDGTLSNSQSFTVLAGTYAVSETAVTGWQQTSAVCSDGSPINAVVVAVDETVTCTFTNTKLPKLTVVKVVTNNNGGTKQIADFPLFIDSVSTTSGTKVTSTVGSHTVTETSQAGYTGTFSGACDANGVVVLAAGDDVTCTITNDDQPGTLTVVKVVENDNGGTATPDDFTFQVDGAAAIPFNANGTNVLVKDAGTYDVTEPAVTGYATSYDNCTDVVVPNGGNATCTITNRDIAPKLTLVKTVENNYGGQLEASDFSLYINNNLVVTGQANTLQAGAYTASEDQEYGYTASAWGGACAADGTITLTIGDDVTCTITNSDIQPKLTLIKTVTNDNGGQKGVADFPLNVSGTTVTSGVKTGFNAGSYTAGEQTDPGYTASAWGGDCAADGSITLSVGDDLTCTITNDDKAATLTVIKNVINDNGGTLVASDFTMSVTAGGASPASFPGSATSTEVTLNAGAYSVGETQISGYAMTLGANCSGSIANGESKTCTVTNNDQPGTLIVVKNLIKNNGGTESVTDFSFQINGGNAIPFEADASNSNTVNAGTYNVVEPAVFGYSTSYNNCSNLVIPLAGTATCTITNDDIAPTLTLVKTVVNNYGGTKQVSDFALFIDGNPVTSGNALTIAPGNHTATETNLPGYTASAWGGDCAANGTVNLTIGQNKTCTITNSDTQPKLTLVKTVQNDHGGTKTVADFPLNVSGTTVTSGVKTGFNAGSYTAGEQADPGYTASAWGGDCDANGSITLTVGDDKTCTITNDDKAATLTVIKTVVNNSGGTKVAADFTMSVTGTDVSPASFPGSETGTLVTLDAGAYSVGETGPSGYAASYSADCTGTLANGESKTCTVTNDDQPGTLIVQKVLINDNGGTGVVTNFSFKVNGGSSIPFEGDAENQMTVNAGVYDVVEDAATGYTTTYNNCEDVVVPNGGSATCVITNNDIQPRLTVTKVVVNNNGGTMEIEDFPLDVSGTSVVSGVQNGFNVGTYTVGEVSDPGYSATITGDCNAQGSVSLVQGDVKACTITNDDQPGTLIVKKVVVNDDGGTKTAANFTFSVNQATSVAFEADGQNDLIVNAGTYSVVEDADADYSTTYDNCTNLVIPNAGTATCTITNDDIAPKLTVTKVVINDNGGTKVVADFPLFVNATSVTSGVQNSYSVGSYTVSETELSGYVGSIGGDCAADGTVALDLGDVKSCTITNDDQAGTLIVRKIVVNDDGGGATADDFSFTVNGGDSTFFEIDGENAITVNAGTYDVVEDAFTGYTTTYSNCEDVVVANGGSSICTITNNDQPATLTVIKTVINDNGGTKVASDFTMSVTGTDVSPASFLGSATGTPVTLDAGSYSVGETQLPGYTMSLGANCSGTIANGESKTCTVTNDDQAGTLIVEKVLIQDDGGDATFPDFGFTVNGGTATPFESDGDNSMTVNAGVYTVVEPGVFGYTTTYENCTAVAVANGETEICTITNDDIAPTLTLTKVVVNDNGGTLLVADFPLFIDQTQVASGQANTLLAGTYTASETSAEGYAASDWTGDCDADGEVVLSVGQNLSCTITNDDQPSTLIVQKVVTNDHGGTATADDFSFAVNGGTSESFEEDGENELTVNAGTYNVVEDAATGYTTSYEGCADIVLGLGETATCVITNNDIAPQLTIIKNVINDDGGTLTAGAFTLAVTATDPSSASVTGAAAPGVTITLDAGAYTVTEPDALGYIKSFSTDCVGTIAIGETKTCTVTNNDMPQEREGTIGFWRNWNMHKKFTAEQINGWLVGIDAGSAWLLANPLAGYTNDTAGMVKLINDATGCKGSSLECTQKKFYAQYMVTRLNVESGKKNLDATYDLTLLPAGTSYLGVSATPTLGEVITAIESKFGTNPTKQQFNLIMTVCDTINNIGL